MSSKFATDDEENSPQEPVDWAAIQLKAVLECCLPEDRARSAFHDTHGQIIARNIRTLRYGTVDTARRNIDGIVDLALTPGGVARVRLSQNHRRDAQTRRVAHRPATIEDAAYARDGIVEGSRVGTGKGRAQDRAVFTIVTIVTRYWRISTRAHDRGAGISGKSATHRDSQGIRGNHQEQYRTVWNIYYMTQIDSDEQIEYLEAETPTQDTDAERVTEPMRRQKGWPCTNAMDSRLGMTAGGPNLEAGARAVCAAATSYASGFASGLPVRKKKKSSGIRVDGDVCT
ncbi:hypothetical protein C8R44DRAFT_924214 [Mycena epipterygia]|nr:hypothetical protein C8R44DRAFT_924214 [Mycena epipterygia]